jgi:hypothetical protein
LNERRVKTVFHSAMWPVVTASSAARAPRSQSPDRAGDEAGIHPMTGFVGLRLLRWAGVGKLGPLPKCRHRGYLHGWSQAIHHCRQLDFTTAVIRCRPDRQAKL